MVARHKYQWERCIQHYGHVFNYFEHFLKLSLS